MKKSGFNYYPLRTGKLRRYFSLENIVDIWHFIASIFRSIKLLYSYKNAIVFSKGGFVALPVALGAWVLRIPVIAHESDTVPGLANRIISRFAKKVCYSFPLDHVMKEDVNKIYTGTPVRQEIIHAEAQKGLEFLKFNKKNPIILFMGASQGAAQINEVCKRVVGNLKSPFNIVLISGLGKKIHIEDENFKQYEYLDEMFPHILAASDIIVSRSGANSCFECAALKKLCILIPLSHAANDHQRVNAKVLAKASGAKYVEPSLSDEDITTEVVQSINEFLNNTVKCEEYKKNIYSFYKHRAVESIVNEICGFISK